MVEWVIDAAREAGAERVVCVVRPGDGVAEGAARRRRGRRAARGRGHGGGGPGRAGRPAATAGPVVVLSGDHPLVTADQIAGLFAAAPRGRRSRHDPHHRPSSTPPATGASCATRTAASSASSRPSTPRALPPSELAIREINLGTYVFEAPALFEALDQVGLEDGERYLTGVFPVLSGDGGDRGHARRPTTPTSRLGVNDRAGLMDAEALPSGASSSSTPRRA